VLKTWFGADSSLLRNIKGVISSLPFLIKSKDFKVNIGLFDAKGK
jgi:hypothetical protein